MSQTATSSILLHYSCFITVLAESWPVWLSLRQDWVSNLDWDLRLGSETRPWQSDLTTRTNLKFFNTNVVSSSFVGLLYFLKKKPLSVLKYTAEPVLLLHLYAGLKKTPCQVEEKKEHAHYTAVPADLSTCFDVLASRLRQLPLCNLCCFAWGNQGGRRSRCAPNQRRFSPC